MDVQKYYSDIRTLENKLMEDCGGNAVYITSVYNREKNSTDGATCSASAYNAARAITDGTHRLATPEEIRSFIQLQEKNNRDSVEGEIRKRQQYITVVSQTKVNEELPGLGEAAAVEVPSGEKKSKAR